MAGFAQTQHSRASQLEEVFECLRRIVSNARSARGGTINAEQQNWKEEWESGILIEI